MSDDTRDIVIELRAEVKALKSLVERLVLLIDRVDKLEADREREHGRNSVLIWLGAAVIAAAGGMGAIVAKWAGWVAVVANK